jgi:putative solute:sodium symporter small subunit
MHDEQFAHTQVAQATQVAPTAASALLALTSRAFWLRYRTLTYALLGAWFISTFGVLFFARELSTWVIFGWSFSVYMAAQGLTLFYVALLGIFAYFAGNIEHDQTRAEQTLLNTLLAPAEIKANEDKGRDGDAIHATQQING